MSNFGLFRGFSEKLFEGELPINLGMVKNNFDDTDYTSFLARVSNAGGSLNDTEKLAILNLITQLKSDQIWPLMKAIYPMVGASAAACAQNLKSASFTGTFTATGWSFSSAGVTPDGTSAFFNTGLNLLSNYGTSFNNHFSVYYRTVGTTSEKIGAFAGNFDSGMSAHLNLGNGGGYFNDNMGRNVTSAGSAVAFHLSSLLSTTSQKLYRNNTLLITGNANSSALYPNLNFYFGAVNNSGTESSYSSRQLAFASLGDGLTDAEASLFYNAVQAFQTTLGRQVQ